MFVDRFSVGLSMEVELTVMTLDLGTLEGLESGILLREHLQPHCLISPDCQLMVG